MNGSWISCKDRLKNTARCSSCTFYMAVNSEGGICIRLIKTGKEKAQPSDGYDDLVNADDQCRYWSDGKEGVKHGNPLERHDSR